MEIVIAFNEKFLMPAGVMLCSLFENNKADEIHLHALLNHESSFAQPVFDIVEHYGGHLHIYDMSSLNLPSLPLDLPNQRTNISIECYYRLFVSEVIPATIDKVLYLDCDTIIADSITNLWNEDISGVAVGATPDFENNNVKFSNRLGYDTQYGYFNSGILLINLKYWREHDVTQKFLEYIKTHQDELFFHDQDVLNYEFHQQKKELLIRYNFQTTFLFLKGLRNISCKYFDQIDEAFRKPCIIHYTEDKPWFSDTTNPMSSYFIKYYNLTIWNGKSLKRREKNLKSIIRHLISLIKGEPKSNWRYRKDYL